MILYDKKYGKKSHCRISLLLPEIQWVTHKYNLYGDNVSTKLISFPTKFTLINNNNYIFIQICIFGFGLKLKVLE